ncbi:MAG: fibronectin type III domain-containing protein [Phycisphaerae bacterium]|nr:fibronectin type III domain-containing protein [Phycisphaerae bacterium]
MARFPLKEAEIVALAEAMETGLAANVAIYPAPPVAVLDLTAAKTAYITAANAAIAAYAAAEAATTAKDDKLDDLIEAMKSDLRYAENTVNFDDDKLKLIGWGGRAAATALTPPGQARLLEAPRQGEGWVYLDWKAPTDGGKPAAYRVMRRERPAGAWEDVATAVITEATLVEQPRTLELEYRIAAVNTAGEGEPSNTAMVVL